MSHKIILFIALTLTALIILFPIFKYTKGELKKLLLVLFVPALISNFVILLLGKEYTKASIIFGAVTLGVYLIYKLYSFITNSHREKSTIKFNKQYLTTHKKTLTNLSCTAIYNSQNTLLSKIKGKHIYGLTIDENKSIEILLYSNRLTFMDGSHEIEIIEFDEYVEVEARLKEVVVGSTTVAHKEVGLASTVAALKGDWLAAIALSPNTTTYTTRPDIEAYWVLWIESTGLYVIQVDSESKLRKFVDSCNTAIDDYQAKQLLDEETEEQTQSSTNVSPLVQDPHPTNKSESGKISINKMTGVEFEEFCTNLLSKNGFTNVIHTGGPNDQGADIVATKDGIKYAFQCKCYSSPLGNTPVQEALAGKQFRKCHIGVVITNSTFTKGAKELADSTQIILWDNTKLKKLLYNTDLKDKYNL